MVYSTLYYFCVLKNVHTRIRRLSLLAEGHTTNWCQCVALKERSHREGTRVEGILLHILLYILNFFPNIIFTKKINFRKCFYERDLTIGHKSLDILNIWSS